MTPTYTKMMPNGGYEYGLVEINHEDRRKDRLIRIGITVDYECAERARARLVRAANVLDAGELSQ